MICFETGLLAEAGVAGHGGTILTVHGAGAGVLETYSFESRQPWEEDWSEVFPRAHPYEVAMVQAGVVAAAAAAVLNPVVAYLSLLFWLSTQPNYSGPYLPLFHPVPYFPFKLPARPERLAKKSELPFCSFWLCDINCVRKSIGFEPSFSSIVGVTLPSSLVGVLSPISRAGKPLLPATELNAFINEPFAPAAKSGSPCSLP